MVVAQAGSQRYGFYIPNSFQIKSGIGFFLVARTVAQFFRNGFLMPPVKAVFQGMLVEQAAVQIHVCPCRAEFCIQFILVPRCFVPRYILQINVGLGFTDESYIGTAVFEIGGVLGQSAVAGGVVVRSWVRRFHQAVDDGAVPANAFYMIGKNQILHAKPVYRRFSPADGSKSNGGFH